MHFNISESRFFFLLLLLPCLSTLPLSSSFSCDYYFVFSLLLFSFSLFYYLFLPFFFSFPYFLLLLSPLPSSPPSLTPPSFSFSSPHPLSHLLPLPPIIPPFPSPLPSTHPSFLLPPPFPSPPHPPFPSPLPSLLTPPSPLPPQPPSSPYPSSPSSSPLPPLSPPHPSPPPLPPLLLSPSRRLHGARPHSSPKLAPTTHPLHYPILAKLRIRFNKTHISSPPLLAIHRTYLTIHLVPPTLPRGTTIPLLRSLKPHLRRKHTTARVHLADTLLHIQVSLPCTSSPRPKPSPYSRFTLLVMRPSHYTLVSPTAPLFVPYHSLSYVHHPFLPRDLPVLQSRSYPTCPIASTTLSRALASTLTMYYPRLLSFSPVYTNPFFFLSSTSYYGLVHLDFLPSCSFSSLALLHFSSIHPYNLHAAIPLLPLYFFPITTPPSSSPPSSLPPPSILPPPLTLPYTPPPPLSPPHPIPLPSSHTPIHPPLLSQLPYPPYPISPPPLTHSPNLPPLIPSPTHPPTLLTPPPLIHLHPYPPPPLTLPATTLSFPRFFPLIPPHFAHLLH
ncbi:hypothetical protein C7M84_021766 [Penaeus vannamei]|uniref:Uncharacterized protein n=1 Tax=Penaeus vannamei TaxID=6689 RepID=A0A3R7MFP9_PENVA|nr:hypothetical protein C7M84_021766 [Penaeus vannamei]